MRITKKFVKQFNKWTKNIFPGIVLYETPLGHRMQPLHETLLKDMLDFTRVFYIYCYNQGCKHSKVETQRLMRREIDRCLDNWENFGGG